MTNLSPPREEAGFRLTTLLALVVLAASSPACNVRLENLDPPPRSPESQVARDTTIILERAECASGACPVYRVSLFGDGTAVVDSAKARRHTMALEGSEIVALADEIEQKNFFELEEKAACSEAGPPATISVTHHGKSRTFKHTLGCAPDEAEQIVTRIDTVARANKWAW